MKKSLVCSLVILFLLTFWIGAASATYTMEVIGTAQFVGATDPGDPEYKLIWDPDNNGNSVVWLDYTNDYTNWNDQSAWAAGLDNALDITLYSGYSVIWTDSSWRLPNQNGVLGLEQTEYEMGHLYYSELDNSDFSPLTNYGDFDNLWEDSYWSGTEREDYSDQAMLFDMYSGEESYIYKSGNAYGLAIRTGDVSVVPEPTTSLLLGIGLLGLAGITRCRKGSRC